ncbi:CaiB/BaiF CoA transferase family protein [Mesorhizobium australicum]|uniref:Crotonobetainyl-CoA:carnitine CoA-transferase CaiB n=1 Tax=Mesorhizobium australicum TaxID=536018 RepID=A0A1X7MSE8_9HYPH|nr:CaiB/BaiF CoA-transferase family protein [Mesorhizobium australicum]SMH27752.1 Crotonobetainyl-CoA:carnitine CoA-transferase CaiB [Mesorhizobium australicum]
MTDTLPLAGIRILDFGHTVMGPVTGMILADLGAEVIKIEPIDGEPTRRLKGFGAGYFGYFNRNKKSVVLDLKSPDGREAALRLVDTADVVIENFGPGTMERLGLGETTLRARNPRLVFASLKGFMPGPYETRLALDEVVQMMSGLAYMTGLPGKPLRAGTSVVDIAGGMFAVIGILVALMERRTSNSGALVRTALFETCVFLMGQHLCVAAQSSEPVPPMPVRVSAWSVYEVFDLAHGDQLFVGITSDIHWRRFCDKAGLADLAADPELATNNQRIAQRDRLIPMLKQFFEGISKDEGIALCEAARIPFAPIQQPEDLFDDPHLKATGGLGKLSLPDGTTAELPRLPMTVGGRTFSRFDDPPAAGAHSAALLAEIGYSSEEIRALTGSVRVVPA